MRAMGFEMKESIDFILNGRKSGVNTGNSLLSGLKEKAYPIGVKLVKIQEKRI